MRETDKALSLKREIKHREKGGTNCFFYKKRNLFLFGLRRFSASIAPYGNLNIFLPFGVFCMSVCGCVLLRESISVF